MADPDYGWDRVCEQRFGTYPAQVYSVWNTATHVQDNEQDPETRPLAKQELQDFFDHADDQVAVIANTRKKGWLPAYRELVSAMPAPLVAEMLGDSDQVTQKHAAEAGTTWAGYIQC